MVIVGWAVYTFAFQPSDCQYSAWGACNAYGYQTRTIQSMPRNGGQPCTLSLVQPCTQSSSSSLPPLPPVDNQCKYSDWSDWSSCSYVDCSAFQTNGINCLGNLPKQYRWRVPDPSNVAYGLDCPSAAMFQFQDCDASNICGSGSVSGSGSGSVPQDCVPDDAWGPFGPCGQPCSTDGSVAYKWAFRGIKTPAGPGGRDCDISQLVTSATCNMQPCATCQYGQPSSWSECSVPMGQGIQYRTVPLLAGSADECLATLQTQPCVVTPASACAPYTWDMVQAECDYLCSSNDASISAQGRVFTLSNGSVTCPITAAVLNASGRCFVGSTGKTQCGLPTDCQYSTWSSQSACSGSCQQGGGTQIRVRTIVSPPKNGGADCDLASLVQQIPCNVPGTFVTLSQATTVCTPVAGTPVVLPSPAAGAQNCLNTPGCTGFSMDMSTHKVTLLSNVLLEATCTLAGSSSLTNSATVYAMNCPVNSALDCSLSDWQDETTCGPCGPPFYKTQSRRPVRNALPGGKSCSDFVLFQSVSCGVMPCPSSGSGSGSGSGSTTLTLQCDYGEWPSKAALTKSSNFAPCATAFQSLSASAPFPSAASSLVFADAWASGVKAQWSAAGLLPVVSQTSNTANVYVPVRDAVLSRRLNGGAGAGVTDHAVPVDPVLVVSTLTDPSTNAAYTVSTVQYTKMNFYRLTVAGWVTLATASTLTATFGTVASDLMSAYVREAQSSVTGPFFVYDDATSGFLCPSLCPYDPSQCVLTPCNASCQLGSLNFATVTSSGLASCNVGAAYSAVYGSTPADAVADPNCLVYMYMPSQSVTYMYDQPWSSLTAAGICTTTPVGSVSARSKLPTGRQVMTRDPLIMGPSCQIGEAVSVTSCGGSLPQCAPQCPIGCNGQPCSGHGACVADPTGLTLGICQCTGGWEGAACDGICPVDQNGLVCNGNGTCGASTNYECVCNAGFVGAACELGLTSWLSNAAYMSSVLANVPVMNSVSSSPPPNYTSPNYGDLANTILPVIAPGAYTPPTPCIANPSVCDICYDNTLAPQITTADPLQFFMYTSFSNFANYPNGPGTASDCKGNCGGAAPSCSKPGYKTIAGYDTITCAQDSNCLSMVYDSKANTTNLYPNTMEDMVKYGWCSGGQWNKTTFGRKKGEAYGTVVPTSGDMVSVMQVVQNQVPSSGGNSTWDYVNKTFSSPRPGTTCAALGYTKPVQFTVSHALVPFATLTVMAMGR